MKLKSVFNASAFPWLYGSLLILLCIAYAWRPLEGGSDLWAHAAVGKWIWDTGSIPRETLFIWSEPNTPWIAHSWLSELLFFGLLAQGGAFSVAVFNAAMVVLTFCVLWRLWNREGSFSFWVPMLFALTIWISAPRFQPRPELFSALLLTLLLCLLWKKTGERRSLWLEVVAVFFLFLFWANLHGAVAIGLLLLGGFAVCELIQGKFSRSAWKGFFLLGVAIVAVCLTPYGVGYWQALRPVGGAMFAHIDEWKPMWAPPVMFDYLAALAVLGVIALLAWLANPQRNWSQLLCLLLSVALTLNSRRMLWLAAVLFLAVTAVNARYLDSATLWKKWRKLTGGDTGEVIPDAMRLIARVGAVTCLVAWTFAAASRHTPQEAGAWNVYVCNVPEGAVQFLQPRAASLRIFNDYEDSSYLQWRLNGELSKTTSTLGSLPLYIDLLNAYPDSLMFEYLDILAARPQALQKLDERKINCIVLGEHHWKQPLVSFLNRSNSNWESVWNDKQSKVWIKRKPNVN